MADTGGAGKLWKWEDISSSSFDGFIVGNMDNGTVSDWFVVFGDITGG